MMGKSDNRQPTLSFVKRPTRNKDTGSATQTLVPETQLDSESEDDIKSILKDAKSYLKEIDVKIDSLAGRLDKVSRKVDKHDAKITELETRVSDIQDRQNSTQDHQVSVNSMLEALRAKNEDLEGRSRRNNVRFTGVPETTDIPNMEQYIKNLFKDLFREALSPMFLVERAHRSLGPRPKPGTSPHPILARILNYRDRDTILRLARERGELRYQNNVISLYPDFTQAVQAARREFLPAKKILQQTGTKYAMLYPAKLRVQTQGKPLIFTEASAAMKFAKQHSRQHREMAASARSQLSDND